MRRTLIGLVSLAAVVAMSGCSAPGHRKLSIELLGQRFVIEYEVTADETTDKAGDTD